MQGKKGLRDKRDNLKFTTTFSFLSSFNNVLVQGNRAGHHVQFVKCFFSGFGKIFAFVLIGGYISVELSASFSYLHLHLFCFRGNLKLDFNLNTHEIFPGCLLKLVLHKLV